MSSISPETECTLQCIMIACVSPFGVTNLTIPQLTVEVISIFTLLAGVNVNIILVLVTSSDV